jgi:beta-glucosidase/6-phospho-beta-glucosidase/beta-galactosidase
MAVFVQLILLLSLFTAAPGQYVYEEPLLYDTFDNDFIWGVATSAYQVQWQNKSPSQCLIYLCRLLVQIEGGWDQGGKGISIWDTFSDTPGKIIDGTDGKVACDSYNKYEEDARIIKAMGVDSYRFSISWPRIIPGGTGLESAEGIQYYKNLIGALKAQGIQPVATLYHWDLPQALQDQGGWLNADINVWFEEYARVCFREFGDDVGVR